MIVELLTLIYQTLLNKREPLKTKEDMSVDQKEIKETPAVIYVWGKTEKAGKIVTEDKDKSDAKFMAFDDGSRCARNLLGEMLLLARNQEDANNLALGFNPAANVSANNENVDHQEALDTASEKGSTKFQEPVSGEINVMMEMLRKMSAKNHASMPVKVNIPSKDVYDLFKDQMDITKKDLNSQIGLLVESQIDNLREQLKEQIESFIKNYYNGTTTKSGNAKS
tara:strand:+ start:859 stop:1530 length:672 start_codon:yes stop_codon:yes gene_type:complete